MLRLIQRQLHEPQRLQGHVQSAAFDRLAPLTGRVPGHVRNRAMDALIDAGVFISDALGRKPNSRVSTAVLNKRVS